MKILAKSKPNFLYAHRFKDVTNVVAEMYILFIFMYQKYINMDLHIFIYTGWFIYHVT